MQHENIVIADICVELRKLAKSGILAGNTAESCKQAASLLERVREVVLTAVQGNPEGMTHTKAMALGKDLHWVMVKQGEG